MRLLDPAAKPPSFLVSRDGPEACPATVLRDLTLVFADVAGSTALYARLGDGAAYALIRRRLAALGAGVRDAGGSVVKTIGDGALAWDGSAGRDEPCVRLRVGVHRGPAIAAAADGEAPDYFGLTVNGAARLCRVARAGEVCVGREVLLAPGVAVLLAGLPAEPAVARLAGVGGPPATVFRPRHSVVPLAGDGTAGAGRERAA